MTTRYLSSSSVTDVMFFIVECGIARFLCAVRVFEVRASSSSPRLPLYQISASPWRKIAYALSLNHSAYLMRREPKLALRNNTIGEEVTDNHGPVL